MFNVTHTNIQNECNICNNESLDAANDLFKANFKLIDAHVTDATS